MDKHEKLLQQQERVDARLLTFDPIVERTEELKATTTVLEKALVIADEQSITIASTNNGSRIYARPNGIRNHHDPSIAAHIKINNDVGSSKEFNLPSTEKIIDKAGWRAGSGYRRITHFRTAFAALTRRSLTRKQDAFEHNLQIVETAARDQELNPGTADALQDFDHNPETFEERYARQKFASAEKYTTDDDQVE